MAKPRSLDAKINALTHLVEKGFAAVSSDISHRPTNSSVAGIVESYIAHLPTRKDMSTMFDERLQPLSAELRSIRKDLERLTETVDNITGLPKEIDHALERIAKIERHLGLNEEIAA
jgi:hypothetical protein